MGKKENGAGSIRQRPDGTWEGRYSAGVDPGTGKLIRKSIYGKTQKDVRERLTKIISSLDDGIYLEPSKLTVGQWFDIWLTEYCKEQKYLTVKQYRSMTDTHIKPGLGAVKLDKLTGPQVQKFFNDLSVTGRTIRNTDRKTGKVTEYKVPLSPKTIRNIHGIMSKAFTTAIQQGMMKRNPVEYVSIPKVEKKEIAPLTDDQIKQFLTVCAGHDFERVFKLILFTGLREGEALGLTWDCVDFDAGTLKINKQMQKRPARDGGYMFAPLKNDKPRTLTAPPFVMQMLKDQSVHQLEQRLSAGESWKGWQSMKERETGLVFTRPDGTHLDVSVLYKTYKKFADLIGAPDSRVHDLRHTYAVVSLQNGDDIKTLQGNLGHATAAFTLDVYGHVSDKMKQASADRMQVYHDSLG